MCSLTHMSEAVRALSIVSPGCALFWLNNALLRQQLIVLQRHVKRPALTWRDRALFVLFASKLPSWDTALMIVQPDTPLRWHRDLFRRVWRRKSRRKGKKGRDPLAEDIVTLIKKMAKDNRTWGAERIRGELLKLGIQVAKSTIQRYINQVRSPVPTSQTWGTFLRNHAKPIWAVDFLQTYDLFFRAIFVFVVIELGSRRLVHFGVTRSPNDAWVGQGFPATTCCPAARYNRIAFPISFSWNRCVLVA